MTNTEHVFNVLDIHTAFAAKNLRMSQLQCDRIGDVSLRYFVRCGRTKVRIQCWQTNSYPGFAPAFTLVVSNAKRKMEYTVQPVQPDQPVVWVRYEPYNLGLPTQFDTVVDVLIDALTLLNIKP